MGDDLEVVCVCDGGDGGGKVVPVSDCSKNERVMIKISSNRWYTNFQAMIQTGRNMGKSGEKLFF